MEVESNLPPKNRMKYYSKFKLRDIEEFSGSVKFIHEDIADHSSAFNVDEVVILELSIPYNVGANEVILEVYDGAVFKFEAKALPYDICSGLEKYRFKVNEESFTVGIYSACFKSLINGSYYYSRGSYNKLSFSKYKKSENFFQITRTDFKYVLPKEKNRGIIYHIFVDRFAKSEGSTISSDWNFIPEYPLYPGAPIKNDTFWGGTLHGIIDKLYYIKSLGATAIYLSPIFLSPSNHRYDTSDYMQVDPALGGDAALEKLIKEAKKRKIGIILDGVFNHTGSESIYFNKNRSFDSLGAYQSKDSPYYKWYNFIEFPHKYECWWGISILPRINPDEPSCRRYFIGSGGVIEKYTQMGILGFRLDVCDELSDDFIKSIKKKMSRYGKKLLYGEVWEDASNKIAYSKRKSYYLGDELDGVMNYPLRDGLIDYVKYKSTEKLHYALTDVFLNAPKRVSYMQMNLLGSHDTERILTALGDDSPRGENSELRLKRLDPKQRKRAVRLLKSLYTVIVSLPGLPTVYYGDEAGLEGYSDPFNRMPYPWGREDAELLSHYRLFGAIRNKHEALASGDFEVLFIEDWILVLMRRLGDDSYVTVLNNSSDEITVLSDDSIEVLSKNITTTKYSLQSEQAEIFKIKEYKSLRIKRKQQW